MFSFLSGKYNRSNFRKFWDESKSSRKVVNFMTFFSPETVWISIIIFRYKFRTTNDTLNAGKNSESQVNRSDLLFFFRSKRVKYRIAFINLHKSAEKPLHVSQMHRRIQSESESLEKVAFVVETKPVMD